MIKRRRRFKHGTSLKDRLAWFANDAREKAAILPPGVEKDEMLKKIRRADTASLLDDWASARTTRPSKLRA